MKKYLLSIGALATIAAPIISVVSCGDKDPEDPYISFKEFNQIESKAFEGLKKTNLNEESFKSLSISKTNVSLIDYDVWNELGLLEDDVEYIQIGALAKEIGEEKFTQFSYDPESWINKIFVDGDGKEYIEEIKFDVNKESGSNEVIFTIKTVKVYVDNLLKSSVIHSIEVKSVFTDFGITKK